MAIESAYAIINDKGEIAQEFVIFGDFEAASWLANRAGGRVIEVQIDMDADKHDAKSYAKAMGLNDGN